MSTSTERLRMMTEYSWHVVRAEGERERAATSGSEEIARIHDELADLHILAAEDLSEAWHVFNVTDTGAGDHGDLMIRPLIALLRAGDPDSAQLLLPPALEAEGE